MTNPTIVALTLILVVLMVAARAPRWVAVTTSVVAMLVFNFFFLPPVGTFTIADPMNWVALFTFLAVSLVASHLSAVARSRTEEAVVRRDELARLFDVSRDVLLVTESRQALESLARSIARRFDLDWVAIALPIGESWDVCGAGVAPLTLTPAQLSDVFAPTTAVLEFDAQARTYAGHRTIPVDGRDVHFIPLRVGTTPVGLFATSGRAVEAGTLDALGGIVSLAVERAQFLDDRKTGELVKQSDALKTTLLASIGHDLRTPLTAIRVAAANIQSPLMTDADRHDQSELILTEAERLNRLFQNILEMARIDAGAVAAEHRWVHPSEIIAAARDQAGQSLSRHEIRVEVTNDVPVRLDPRLTASALAQLLENAAQYTPSGASIHVSSSVSDAGLKLSVRDHGPGIAAADLPHLFDRFYRGTAAQGRATGTGMGLWIARGLLAVENGRVWAENCPEGGAEFTIVVPAEAKPAETSEAI
jgi:two-component system sensor histidine kinase KdpD